MGKTGDCAGRTSPRSLFYWGIPSNMISRISADLLPQPGVIQTLKYKKYSCGLKPCSVTKSASDLRKILFSGMPMGHTLIDAIHFCKYAHGAHL